ncbi:MAG: hypothetical protein ACREFB_10360 [Stellaceae bacterium]
MTRPLRHVGHIPHLARHGGAKLAAAARLILRAGFGCTQKSLGESDSAFDRRLAEDKAANAAAMRKARRLWGIA